MGPMNSEDKLRRLAQIAKETEKTIRKMFNESDLKDPVDLDVARTIKAQAYEEMVSILRLK